MPGEGIITEQGKVEVNINESESQAAVAPGAAATRRRSFRGIVQLVAACASTHPEALAAQAGDAKLTYGELQARSGRLARHLQSLGVGPEVVVAVCFPRSIALVVAELAILQAGGAYMPIDPGHPPDRVSFLLNDAGVSLVLAPECARNLLPTGRWHIIGLDPQGRARLGDDGAHEDGLSEPFQSEPQQLAYVIYTSGSTGLPKGVEITHSNLANLVSWHQRAFQVTASDRATLLANPAFDASVWETWPYLAAGASLHIPDDCVRLVSEGMRDWFVKERITISFLPTALAEPMLDVRWPRDTPLRYLLTGADTLRRRPSHRLPFRFVNNYGPTECTVVSTSGEVLEGSRDGSLPTIGRAVDNATIHILDEQLQPVLDGEAGQIYIGGEGVGRGYRNHPALSEERFIPDPFSSSGRLYKTGDLGKFTAGGEVDFLGRVDEQIKIRGHRVEPNEIANALDQNPLVAASAVVARAAGGDETKLVAYVVPASNVALSRRGLQEPLRARLPEYMIPSVFVCIAQLPLTPHGKIDRAALPESAEDNTIHDEAFVAPSTPVQQKLAQIAGDLLRVERVGLHDNFFLLGGHSLLGTQLVTRINQYFGVDLALREVFEAPTIQELAECVEQKIVQKIASMPEEEVEIFLQKAQAS